MSLSSTEIEQLVSLRKTLHMYPELSGKESFTADKIIKFLEQNARPDQIFKYVGGSGVIAVYESNKAGPTVAYRCELDALPIHEETQLPHCSRNNGVAHLCGHDGHMAIACGLALAIKKEPLPTGKVLLVFQPAEETGKGAPAMLESESFKKLIPDKIYALHVLPGLEVAEVQSKAGIFSCASEGMILKLKGRTSHAAQPEKGIAPTSALSSLLVELEALSEVGDEQQSLKLVTIVGAELGKAAFGTAPGDATIFATFRTQTSSDMKKLKEKALSIITSATSKNHLEYQISWVEQFRETINNAECVDVIQNQSKLSGLSYRSTEVPFRWSEDFGAFSLSIKGAMYVIGAGKEWPALHDPHYDFPDQLIATGVNLINNIVRYELKR